MMKTYTGTWRPSWPGSSHVNIRPVIDVEIDYVPGNSKMIVRYKHVETIVRLGAAPAGGDFYDGFGLSLPPAPSNMTSGYFTPGSGQIDNKETALKDFTKWAGNSSRIIYFAGQLNDRSLKYFTGGQLEDGKWHAYLYDISGYSAGESPTLLINGTRGYWSKSVVVSPQLLTTKQVDNLELQIAPKVVTCITSGGTISYSGAKYYEYGTTSDTYTWQPDEGYKISKLTIDGNEIENPASISSWTFENITSDHTIDVVFERTHAKIIYKANAEDTTGTMEPEDYESYQDVIVAGSSFSYRGYKFTGWNTEPDGSGTTISAGDIIFLREDIILYAQWEENPHTIIWIDSLNPDVPIHTEVVLDEHDAHPLEPPFHEGYRLVSSPSSEDLTNITEDKAFTFEYEAIVYTVNVKFVNKHSGREISEPIFIQTTFSSSFDIETYIDEKYKFEEGNMHITDADTEELLSPETILRWKENVKSVQADKTTSLSTIPDSGITKGTTVLTCDKAPARNLNVVLRYDTWIQMPETGMNCELLFTLAGLGLFSTALILMFIVKRKR